MKYLIPVLVLVVGCLALSVFGEQLAGYVDVKRAEAEAQLAQAQAERDRAAAQLAQARTIEQMAETIRAEVSSIVTLAVMLAVWGMVIGVGGVAVAVLALKGNRTALSLPPPHREVLPQPGALAWPVHVPMQIYHREEARNVPLSK